jgi:nucleotide-binding universal stress UspA family protein
MIMIENIRSVLIGTTEEGELEEPAAALGYGLSLAAQASAHVTVQAASLKLVLTHVFVSEIGASLVAAENRRLDALAKAVADSARQAAADSGISCSVETPQMAYPQLIESFTRLAISHDVTVLDAEPVAVAVDRGLIEAVLSRSGRPLIVVPASHEKFKANRIVVAWDGSGKAARAVNDALPLLRAADVVELVSVEGEKDLADTVPGAEIAPHLVRHNVNASVLTLPVVDGDVASTLRNHATLTHADMIVMGAFMHSRFREMILGGVTQSMLKHCPVPLFLSY